MRRTLAAVLLLQFVFLASGVGLVRGGAKCCCSKTSCPMRAHCSAGGRACSLENNAPATVKDQAVHAIPEASFRLAPRRDVRDHVTPAPRFEAAPAVPPEIPPPRAA